jgi:exodeoxyribonuclease III
VPRLSWNVAGLRAVLKDAAKAGVLARLVRDEAPDMLCLSEHKLQDKDVAETAKALAALLPGYTCHWAVSTAKKGYSGVAVLVKGQDTKVKVTFPRIAGVADEGRVVAVEYPLFHVVAAYVPNSGMKLDRLEYRTRTWDAELRTLLGGLGASKPVVYCGDLNVAHEDADIYNWDAKHISKQAGTTREERQSFAAFLSEERLVDTFRRAHPVARGVFTYWSTRAGNRPFNKGLRLDYFLAPERMYDADAPAKVCAPRLLVHGMCSNTPPHIPRPAICPGI